MMIMNELTSQQRSYLSKEAHRLNPIVMVGQKGLTDSLISMVDESLKTHELIKMKFIDFKGTRREITGEICEKCEASLIRIVGNVSIIFRAAEKPEDRKFRV